MEYLFAKHPPVGPHLLRDSCSGQSVRNVTEDCSWMLNALVWQYNFSEVKLIKLVIILVRNALCGKGSGKKCWLAIVVDLAELELNTKSFGYLISIVGYTLTENVVSVAVSQPLF